MDTLRRYKMRSLEFKLLRKPGDRHREQPAAQAELPDSFERGVPHVGPIAEKMALQRTSGTGRWLLHPETQYR